MFVGLVCLAGDEYGGRVWGWVSAETLCRKWAPLGHKHFSRSSFKGIQNNFLVDLFMVALCTVIERSFKDQINTSYCGIVSFMILCTTFSVNILFVCELEGTAEAEIASSTISAEDAGVSLGFSGFSHTSWSSPPSPGLAEVLTALSQTARTWIWVGTLDVSSNGEKKWFHVTTSACVLPIRLAAGGCIGRRFFQASSQAALLRDLRQRIQEVSNFHHTASQALRVPLPHALSSDSQGKSPDNPLQPYLTSPQLHTELVRYL